MVPIYLVKKKLNGHPGLSVSSSSRSPDTTHWALVVNGLHYHITAKGQFSPIKLNPDRIPENELLPWTSSGSKYERVGETTFGDDVIQSRARAIVELMGVYQLLGSNCQEFANMLYLDICSTKPTLDLLGQLVMVRKMVAVGFRTTEMAVRALADTLHVPPKYRIVGPALDKVAKLNGG